MRAYLKRQALSWANRVREANGLPSAGSLERGMLGFRNGLNRSDQCPLARTIGQSEVFIREARCYGKRIRVPVRVGLFMALHDRCWYPELITFRPVRGVSIDHLDFPVDLDDFALEEATGALVK